MERSVTFAILCARWREILSEVAAGDVVVGVVGAPEGTGLYPAGMVANEGTLAFVLGPESICGKVFGLGGDPEYGWPAVKRIEDVASADELMPGHRHHPVIIVGGRSVVSVMASEYEAIVNGS
jgi:hypothetical protein